MYRNRRARPGLKYRSGRIAVFYQNILKGQAVFLSPSLPPFLPFHPLCLSRDILQVMSLRHFRPASPDIQISSDKSKIIPEMIRKKDARKLSRIRIHFSRDSKSYNISRKMKSVGFTQNSISGLFSRSFPFMRYAPHAKIALSRATF